MAAAPTPAIASLIRAKVSYTLRPYDHDPRTTAYGDEVVAALGQDPARVFKTLAAAGGKKAAMAPVAEAERSSGYVAGGISPMGQRKMLTTIVDRSASGFDTVFVSAGRRGLQVELAPADLVAVCRARVAAIAGD